MSIRSTNNLLFRWFVGLLLDATVWHAAVFKKNRDRLIETEVARWSRCRA